MRVIGTMLLLALFTLPASAALCTLEVQDQDFGTVDVLTGTAIDTAFGSVSVTCTRGTLEVLQTDVCINIGNGTGGRDSTGRIMAGPGTLYYQLFSNSGRTVIWGDRAQGFLSVPKLTFTASGTTTQTLTMYGRILPGQQTAAPGAYLSNFNVFAHANIRFGPGVLGLLSCDAIDLGLFAGDDDATFQVRATVDKKCTVMTSPLNFGNTGVLTTAKTGLGALTIRCTNGTTYDVGLGDGENSTGPMARRMKLGSSFISYGLFKTNAYTTPWGNTGSDRVSGTGTAGNQNINVFGRVPPQATPPPGTYKDNVVVTVTY